MARVPFSTALTGTLEDADAALTADLRAAANIDTQIGTSTQTAIDLKANKGANSDITSLSGLTTPLSAAQGGTGVASLAALKTAMNFVKGDVGLGNVDNTSDANKPVSTATQTALDLKAPLASPALTGTPTVPTAAQGTNTTQAASTAFVVAEIAASGGGAGDVTGPASSTDASVAGFNGTTGKTIKQLSATEIRAAASLATTDSPQFAGINVGNASDTTITRASAGVIAVEGVNVLLASSDVAIPTVLTVPNTGLHILDTNASHDLIIKPGSNITADRTLTITTGDADRTLDLTAGFGDMVLLQTQSPSGSTGITFSGFSTYNSTYGRYFIFINYLTGSATYDLIMTMNSVPSSSWNNVRMTRASGAGTPTWTDVSSANNVIVAKNLGSTAYLQSEIQISGIDQDYIAVMARSQGRAPGGTTSPDLTVLDAWGGRSGTTSSLDIAPTSGTITGQISLFGVKK